MKSWIAIAFLLSVTPSLAQTPTPSAKEPPAVIGDKATAGWDKTTLAAAKTKEHEAQLKSGKVVTVTGEVVDASCYLEIGRRGPDHSACGMKCILNGQPIGLIDSKGELYYVISEEHDARRDGKVSIRGKFAVLVGKQATVTGMLTDKDGHKSIFVKSDPVTEAKKTN